MEKWCSICKELKTNAEQQAHESPKLDGTNLFRRVLSCGCSMSKCHVGAKVFYQCKQHLVEEGK